MKTSLFAFLLCLAFCCLTSAQNETPVCPGISISSKPNLSTKPNETVIFTANADDFNERTETGYFWRVEGGKIISGQGTSKIEVVQKFDFIRAIIIFGGLPENCGNIASASTAVSNSPVTFLFGENADFSQIDFYELSNELELRPDSTIFFVLNFERNASRKLIRQKVTTILNNLGEQFVPKEKITIAINKSGKKNTEIWFVQAKAEFPKCKSCEIIGKKIK